jgi:hypothetical protein
MTEMGKKKLIMTPAKLHKPPCKNDYSSRPFFLFDLIELETRTLATSIESIATKIGCLAASW